jgi:hypothetical protein
VRWLCVLGLAGCEFAPGAGARDAAIDDATDAPRDGGVDSSDSGFDPARDCPASYVETLPSSTSRYRYVLTADTAWPLLAACKADLIGATHAIVFDTMQEVLDLEKVLDARMTIERFWAGGVQHPMASGTTTGWIGFDGEAVLGAWRTEENEPDDLDGMENQGQQLLIFDRTLTYFHDATGPGPYGVVCECDGVPVHPTAQAYVDMDPNNPN